MQSTEQAGGVGTVRQAGLPTFVCHSVKAEITGLHVAKRYGLAGSYPICAVYPAWLLSVRIYSSLASALKYTVLTDLAAFNHPLHVY